VVFYAIADAGNSDESGCSLLSFLFRSMMRDVVTSHSVQAVGEGSFIKYKVVLMQWRTRSDSSTAIVSKLHDLGRIGCQSFPYMVISRLRSGRTRSDLWQALTLCAVRLEGTVPESTDRLEIIFSRYYLYL